MAASQLRDFSASLLLASAVSIGSLLTYLLKASESLALTAGKPFNLALSLLSHVNAAHLAVNLAYLWAFTLLVVAMNATAVKAGCSTPAK